MFQVYKTKLDPTVIPNRPVASVWGVTYMLRNYRIELQNKYV